MPGRTGFGEPFQVHRRREGLPTRRFAVPDARRFEGRLLRLERQRPPSRKGVARTRLSPARSARSISAAGRDLWIFSEGARGAEGARDPLRPQTGREAHAQSRAAGLHAQQQEEKRDHPPEQEGRSCGGSGKKGLRGHADGEGLGGGHHLRRLHGRRLPLSGFHPGRLLPQGRWLGDGRSSQDRARGRRPPDGGVEKETISGPRVHHSDQGVQYTALSFSERLKEVGIKPSSMGRTGSTLDNAMAESFVSTLKAKLVSRGWSSRAARRRGRPSSNTWKPSTTPAACTHLLAI